MQTVSLNTREERVNTSLNKHVTSVFYLLQNNSILMLIMFMDEKLILIESSRPTVVELRETLNRNMF